MSVAKLSASAASAGLLVALATRRSDHQRTASTTTETASTANENGPGSTSALPLTRRLAASMRMKAASAIRQPVWTSAATASTLPCPNG